MLAIKTGFFINENGKVCSVVIVIEVGEEEEN